MSQALGYLLISIISVIVAVASFYLSTRASRAQSKAGMYSVDAEAYTRASGIYEETIATFRAEIGQAPRAGDRRPHGDSRSHRTAPVAGHQRRAMTRLSDCGQEHDDLTRSRHRDAAASTTTQR